MTYECMTIFELGNWAGYMDASLRFLNDKFIQFIMPTGQSFYWSFVEADYWCLI